MNSGLLLPIGAFSNATQLSAKALRLYAEQGILVPARIDGETGYRYYRPDQVRVARIVRLMRELDMPLSQIALLLAQPSVSTAAIKEQMDALSARHARQHAAYLALLPLLGSTATAPAVTPPRECSLEGAVTLVLAFDAHAGNLLNRAIVRLAALESDHGLTIEPGAAFIALPAALGEQEESTLELCVPLPAGRSAGPGDTVRNWASSAAVATEVNIINGAPDLVAASDALFDWFDRAGHGLSESPRLYLHPDTPQLVWLIS